MPDRPSAADALARSRRPHLVGVAGTGMRSLATLLADLGHEVTGSDLASGPVVDALAERGVRVASGHRAEHVDDADLVIVSAAVPDDNPELAAARERGVPVLTHAQALGALMDQHVGIGVAGTHGKSTTTALIAHLLTTAGRDPTLVGGADAIDFGGSARLGQGRELVAEADEYGRRFLELRPRFAVITGVEPDHLDYYGSFEAILEAFRQFVAGMPEDGVVVTCEDEPNLAALNLPRRRLRYGWAGHADWRLERSEPKIGGGAAFTVRDPAGERARYEMSLTGRHNAANAVAALAVARALGVSDEAARAGLASFQGTRRRFETVAKRGAVWVVDDYAHHPTAVAVTLEAAREVHGGRIVALFQPHTKHRTASLLDHFARAFGAADRVVLTPIYQPSGRERATETVTSSDLLARMGHPDADVVGSLDEALATLSEELAPGTLILTMGAGDVASVAPRLAALVGSPTPDQPAPSPKPEVAPPPAPLPPYHGAPPSPRPSAEERGIRPVAPPSPSQGGGAFPGVWVDQLERDAPLGRHTSLRVGGPARLFLASGDPQALARALDAAVEDNLPILVLGGGSNLLVADGGFDGLVLKLTTGGYSVETDQAGEPVVRAAAGTLLGNLARRLAREGFGGLEWAATVPGAVGGAVVNNAGAFGGCIADNLLDADIVQAGHGPRTLAVGDLGYAYRTSVLKRGELGPVLVTSARLRVHRTTARDALALIARHQAQRTASQPRQLSAGSIFANPPGDYAGRLIEAAGLKGERRGGAEISAQHANFIVNSGGATATDVYSLIRQVQTTVWERFGIWLHPEVQLVGGWAPDEVAALAGPAEAARG